MQSWQSKTFSKAIWLSGRRRTFLTEEAMQEFIEKNKSRKPYMLDPTFMKKHSIAMFTSDKMDVYVLNQHSIHPKTIVYFHGGAYINEPTGFHWRYLVTLAKKSGCKIFVPVYPKLPHNNYVECYKQLDYFYDKTLSKYNPLIFMGDSAGGGLALAFAQKLQVEGKPGPIHNILFSPWIDMGGNHKGYAELEKIDPMIGLRGAGILAKLWYAPGDHTNYLVSPIYGDLSGICETTVIVGPDELILLDSRRLKEIALKQNYKLNYYEFKHMNHVFPLFPIPEATKVWDIVLPILNGTRQEVKKRRPLRNRSYGKYKNGESHSL